MTMSFSSLFKKASSLLGLGSPEKPPPLDGEIIYCKNNVCVHPPAVLSTRTEHHPGYLNIRSQDDEVLGSTLILTWIPNSTLKNNPRSIENSPARGALPSPRRSPRQEYAKSANSGSPPDSMVSSMVSEGSERQKVAGGPGETGGQQRSSPGSSDSSDGGYHEGYTSGRAKLSESLKSQQSDSGISQDFAGSSVGSDVRNNARETAEQIKANIGQNVNPLRGKHTNVKPSNLDEAGPAPSEEALLSSESDSPGTERQLAELVGNKQRARNPCEDNIRREARRRTSSNRSITSIEMEGDNLVVVTEEIEDAIFLDNEPGDQEGTGARLGPEPESVDRSPGSVLSTSSDSSSYPSPTSEHYKRMIADIKQGGRADGGKAESDSPSRTPDKASLARLKESLDLKLTLRNGVSSVGGIPPLGTPDIEITGSPGASSTVSSTPTSGPDSRPASPGTPPQYMSHGSHTPGSPEPGDGLLEANSEAFACTMNLSFPANSVSYCQSPVGTPKSAKDQLCGVFSVDLGQMRSLRIFYSDAKCTSGQLVIASRESQYKILHFHHGGLDKLCEIFTEWKFLAQPRRQRKEVDLHCQHFSVIRPYLPNDQCHPEEGAYEMVNEETWKQHMNEVGVIEDDFHLRKAIFFAGLEGNLRHEMWPFLLHYYPYTSTIEEREHLRNYKYIEYQNLRKARESMSEEENDRFWRSVQCTVEKDVVRTDRTNPYFKGDDNPNLEILKNILLNYAVAHPHYGYTQGMSDLLAPLLAEIQNEADAYWCFVGLMQNTIFVSSPKDIDMDKQLNYLRELLRIMLPRCYAHLKKVQDGMELLFVHRWILLCFKREFPEVDALRMWEACWAHYQTDYFHLFICVAIISVYGEDVVQQDLPADDMLLHFSSLSMHMSGDVILKKARGLLHKFRTRRKIPCSLEGLCLLCSPGMWDSGHTPSIQCVGNHPDGCCPYGGVPPTKPKPMPQ